MGTSASRSIDLMHKPSKHNRRHIPFLKCSTNLRRLSIPQKRFGKEYPCHFGPSHKTCSTNLPGNHFARSYAQKEDSSSGLCSFNFPEIPHHCLGRWGGISNGAS
uniref:Uncharacterized protein n=1 Tax=Opuntia streptacantha TaxID=393608 RepID=A0A7C9DE72_OPUST